MNTSHEQILHITAIMIFLLPIW